MAGLATISLQQRIDLNGRPYPGARAYFYEADTLTPLITYQNNDLSVQNSNPVTADGYGMFPAVFLDEADEFYRVRVTAAGGQVLLDLVTLPIIGPSDGGGGGGGGTPVDPFALFQTGDTKDRYDDGIHPGWVRCNGRTIGDATSGASERANSDTQALFEHLWNNFPNSIHPVVGGRGASASADFAGHKTISLPDAQARDKRGVDGMGTTASGRLTAASIVTGSPTQVGSSGGTERHTLATTELPVITPAGTITATSHQHVLASNTGPLYPKRAERQTADVSALGPSGVADGSISPVSTGVNDGSHTHPFVGTPFGGGAPHNNMPPFLLFTVYIKL